ncbi:MAG: hypothetical protein MUC88_07370 [Planctomycetes bacterium]|jgi:hypothetical protein|nr:hypothetical protein [Planctomycetota bacterium]
MQKEKLFARIGELTVQFATLEHQLQSLLELLIAENNQVIGPFLIHELNLSILLRKIRHIARFKLQSDGGLLEQLEGTLKRIEATRDLRNLLIHGNWQIDANCTSCPVLVRDFKMRYEDGQWQELTETTFNEKKLTHLIRRLQAMSQDVQHLTRRLGPTYA